MAQKVQPVSFRKLVAALAVGYVEYTVPADGTIERFSVYFPQGQTFDLEIWPVIIQSGSEAPTDIILAAPGTDRKIAGDNVHLNFECARPVTKDDKIRIYYESKDAANEMNLSADVVIDYYAGKVRVP